MEEGAVIEQPQVVHDEPSPERASDQRGTRVDTPFDQAFIDELKGRWPHGERLWDDESETWFVAAGHEEAVEELVIEHFGGCRVVHPDGSETLRDRSGDYEQTGFFN